MLTRPDSKLVPAILASLAGKRWRRFRQAVPAGRHRDILEMYLVDAQLVSHFHATWRALEVLLREQMHPALASAYSGPRWFDDPRLRARLNPKTLERIDQAKAAAATTKRRCGAGTDARHGADMGRVPVSGR
jgi:hypothetical protein